MWWLIALILLSRKSPAAQGVASSTTHAAMLPVVRNDQIAKLEAEPYNVLALQIGTNELARAIFEDKQYTQFHERLDKTLLLGPSVDQQMQAAIKMTASDFGENPGASGDNSSIMGESHLI